MADINHIEDSNNAGADPASTALVAEWLGGLPKHNPASDATTTPKPGDTTPSKPAMAYFF
jgi:hypothetical protein